MPGERNESTPGWSPDGNALVFGREPFLEGGGSGTIAIHILDLRNHQVSTLPGSEGLCGPSWSWDGRYLAAITAYNGKLLLYDFKTHKWVELASLLTNYAYWSKSGEYIYFGNIIGLAAETGFFRLRVSDRKLERLVTLKGLRPALGWEVMVAGTAWSGLAPDGSPLLLRDVGIQEIYALDWEVP